MTTPLPPGWYPDPNGKPEKLYWDGQQWYTAPPPPEEPPPPAPPPPKEPPPPAPPRYTDWGVRVEAGNRRIPPAKKPAQLVSDGSLRPADGPSQPAADPGRPGVIWLGALAVIAFFIFINMGDDDTDDDDTDKGSTATTTTMRPDPMEIMSGDGYYEVGNSQYWGVWQSDGATGDCNWSIRLVDPYAPAEILDEGAAGAGQRPRVGINPLPGRGMGHTLTFMTNGCGSWKWVD